MAGRRHRRRCRRRSTSSRRSGPSRAGRRAGRAVRDDVGVPAEPQPRRRVQPLPGVHAAARGARDRPRGGAGPRPAPDPTTRSCSSRSPWSSAAPSATSSTGSSASPGFLRGEVVDFVDVGRFPTFNVADSAITIGAVLLCHRGAPHRRRTESSRRGLRPSVSRVVRRARRARGERVDRAVAMLTGWSRAEVQAVADRGEIMVDGRVVAKSRKLEAGERVEVLGRPAAAAPPGPEAVPVDVRVRGRRRHRRRQAGGARGAPGRRPRPRHARERPARPLPGARRGRRGRAARHRAPPRPRHEWAAGGGPHRPGVRRPRRRARAPATSTREYVALVWGHPENPRGVVDAPIGRSVTRRDPHGGPRRRARRRAPSTRWRSGSASPRWPACECRLETGRTHQIRVHLAAIGHPVVGDGAYGGRRPGIDLDRPFLHAEHLAFAHPVTGEPLEFADAAARRT